MSCIDKSFIQQYIDKECSENERKQIELHFKECSACRHDYEEMQHASFEIKSLINQLAEDPATIPEFKHSQPLKTKSRRLWRNVAYVLAAACILAFILIIVPRKTTNEVVESDFPFTEFEVDANLPYASQPLTMKIIDPNGTVTEYSLK